MELWKVTFPRPLSLQTRVRGVVGEDFVIFVEPLDTPPLCAYYTYEVVL